jgi:hypothetical protein
MPRFFAVTGSMMALLAVSMAFLVPQALHAGSANFLIPASEGYGVADCLVKGDSCGQIVANAWCEAHGYGVATAFGEARPEDMTASTPALSPKKDPPILISCGE